MKVNIVGKNITVTEGISDKIHKKLDVLTKYFIIGEDDVANVLVRTYPPAIIFIFAFDKNSKYPPRTFEMFEIWGYFAPKRPA